MVGSRQYGLNTLDGVNVVLLISEEALFSAEDMCSGGIDGRNTFNEVKRQKILDFI